MFELCGTPAIPLPSDKRALLYQILTFDTVPPLEGIMLVIVLSHLKGNYYLTASVLNTHMKPKFFEWPLRAWMITF